MNTRAFLSILLAIVLASCSGDKRYTIGVSQCSVDNWRDKFNNELRTSSYLYDNVTLKIVSANDDSRQQIEQINHLVDNGVDLLIVSPNQLNSISAALQRATERHIPVILFDRKAASSDYTAFIGADNRRLGHEMGEYVARRLGGKGRIVEMIGLKGSSPAIERHEGFAEAIRQYPGIEIVATAHGDWLKDSSHKAMEAILKSGVAFDCIFAQNDRMALGAREAVEESRMRGDSIVYVGVDALPTDDGGLANVLSGKLDASYIYPTRGDLVMQLAMNILEYKPYLRDNNLTGTIVTSDNVEALLLQSEELSKLQSRLDLLHGKVDLYLSQYSHQRVYGVMMTIIIVLLIVSFAVAYRSIIVKRNILEQTTNAKLRFFTNVSHEFRTPITLLADPVERLLSDPDTTVRQRQLLVIMRRNVGVLLRLVGDILDFRKVQNGKMSVQLSRFDLCAAVRDWAETFIPLAERKRVDITLRLPERLDCLSDARKMERICYNLLSNAMKYTQGGGQITVTLADIGGGKMQFSVADTGVGIPQDKLADVFERFYQVKGTSAEASGTGIGLALVKAFAELLGGSVTVESAVGRGSVFTVVLPKESKGEPLVSPPDTPIIHDKAAETADIEPSPISKMGMRATNPDVEVEQPEVLVVDDNDDILTYIAALLGDDYDVRTAHDGQEALDIATKEVPDIVVCDVMMPVMDGLELCRRLKTATATSHIPILMLTARTLEEQRIEGYEYGADAYIEKPFNGNLLLARIRNLIDNRKRLRSLFAGDSPTEEPRRTDADTVFVDKLKQAVQARLSDSELSVETLGADMGLSRVQLYRKVKALTGLTPVEIIRTTRLRKAEQLLSAGDKTVSEVAYEVGFSSPSYFSKCYKDFFGRTPGDK